MRALKSGAKTATIVLAAGASTRLGSPKQLVRLGAETLLERAVRIAREAGCAPVVVVLGANAAAVLAACSLGDAVIVINADWAEGMSASIACGVAAVEGEVDSVILMACDQPSVTPAHLRALQATGSMTASAYADRRGIPAFFPAAAFDDLLELHGDQGARALLKSARSVGLSGGEIDIDTIQDVAKLAL